MFHAFLSLSTNKCEFDLHSLILFFEIIKNK